MNKDIERTTFYLCCVSKRYYLFLLLMACFQLSSQTLGLLKYDGGGDWYANPTALENLSNFYNAATGAKSVVASKEIGVSELLLSGVSFLHATGHGRIIFSPEERATLQKFTQRGGFIHIDDNYGMKDFAEAELDKCFPHAEKVNVALNHPIFHRPFEMQGLPKIHEHENERPQAIGYFVNSELIALLTIESDIGDGWEDTEVHNDPQEKRENALKMGANLVHWAIVRNE